MIIVHNIFEWHRVIVVSTHDNLAAYEKSLKKMMADTPENRAMNEKFKDMNEMYVSGPDLYVYLTKGDLTEHYRIQAEKAKENFPI